MKLRTRIVVISILVLLIAANILSFFGRDIARHQRDYGTSPNAGPVYFTEYKEQVPWQHLSTDRFTIALPPGWRIGPPTPDEDNPARADYAIHDPSEKAVLEIWTQPGCYRYLACLCTSKSHYQFSGLDGVRIWYWQRSPLGNKGFKAASEKFSVDIHYNTFDKELLAYDEKMMCHLIESLRPRQ